VAAHAVVEDEAKAAVAQRREQLARLVVERLQPLDRDDPLAELRQQRGLVAAAGADLEDRAEVAGGAGPLGAEEKLEHARDDRGLRDRLAVPIGRLVSS
jgi:hypothetical protein